jgi:hypothetical protein
MANEYTYTYKMEVPVIVSYSRRDDGSTSIDFVTAPSEHDMNDLIDKNAADIISGARGRLNAKHRGR